MKLVAKSHHQDEISYEQFQNALPRQIRKNLDPAIMDKVNDLVQDPSLREAYRENLLSYAGVMQEGKYKIETYIDAIKFVSMKLMGATDIGAWTAVFPDRHKHYLSTGADARKLAAVASAYKKGVLVNKIMEQTLIPSYVLNADLYQKALNKLADLMMNAKSEKVQSDSAGKLVDALKQPETQKIELDVNVSEDRSIQELRESTMALVAQQKAMLSSGLKTPQEIAHSKLKVIDSEGNVIDED